ncbi:MAG TPA: lysylphosphatidylglycerol synthase transmembrane domain-containing protein [Phycisphaerae bacterium]|nr:lysylphosphatidylglycerol synthase transmembrane domain-containing protein [Phycisphaerae bacterium]
MSATAKKWGLRLLKIGVCAAALWYLSTKVTLNDYVRLEAGAKERYLLVSEAAGRLTIQDADTGAVREISYDPPVRAAKVDPRVPRIERGLKTVIRNADWSWTGWALAAFAPVTFVIAWRLRLLLATQEIVISFRDALLLTFAGNFFNFAMPGSTGGDLYKAYHIAKRTDKRVQGVTVVVLDRVVGLLSFLLIAAIVLMFAGRTGRIGAYGQVVGYLTAGLVAVGLVFFSRRVRAALGYERWLSKLPFAEKIKRIDETTFSFRYHKMEVFLALLVTLASHVCLVTYVYLLARGFGMHATGGQTEWDLYFAVLIATVVGFLFAAIPISFQGFGLMEAVFIRVLVQGNWCDYSTMLALTLSIRLVQIVWSLPGIIVPWLGLERPPESVSEESLEAMPQTPV